MMQQPLLHLIQLLGGGEYARVWKVLVKIKVPGVKVGLVHDLGKALKIIVIMKTQKQKEED